VSDHNTVDQLDTSTDAAVLGDAYADPTGTDPSVFDLDENGVDDAVAVELAPGVTGLIVDIDEDGRPDTVLIDGDGDGTFETQVCPDGAGAFLLGFDDDGDGIVDREETVERADLEAMAPGLAEVLDPAADPPTEDTDGGTDGSGTDAGTEDWSVADGRIIGDPAETSEHWFQQAANGFCAPASIAQIVAQYSGASFTDETAFVALANELGVWQVGPDGVPGLTVEGAAAVLEASGVPAAIVTGGGITMLADYLDSGHGIMVAIDSGEVWYGEAAEDGAPDHMVVVAGIDVDRGVVLLSDPGSPDGNLEEVPVEVFMDAWADSDHTMIVAEDPAPAAVGGPDPDTSPGGGSVAASQIAAATASVVEEPWVLLPVALTVRAA
jgi:hypothetical protein